MKSYILLALVAGVHGACPNSCSSRGVCIADDVCSCYTGWSGGDCSYRTCPFGASWSVNPAVKYSDDRTVETTLSQTPGGYIKEIDDGNGGLILDIPGTYDELYPKVPAFREYTECSSRGNCNYATGRCNCFTGYEGRGCRRTSCPNKCSGHGKCMLNSEVNQKQYQSINKYNSQFWDQDRTQQCVCDRGFSGYDCSDRVCPSGDNPVSNCGEGSATDYQLVYVSADSVNKDDYFTLKMRDTFGGTVTTRPINAHACTVAGHCNEVQYALMELPNFAVPEVEVDLLALSSLGTGEQAYLISFKDPANAGKQNTLECEPVPNPMVNGAAPKYNPVVACHVFHAGMPEWYNPDESLKAFKLNGKLVTRDDVLPAEARQLAEDVLKQQTYRDFIPCSGRGTCNTDTGTCKCAEGTTGQGCRVSTIFS